MSKFLHIMSTKQAISLRVNNFYAKISCKVCGEREKYMLNFCPNSCLCVGCYPEPWKDESCGDINSAQNKHNKQKAKLKKENWSLPTVYGGYNTI